MPSLREQLLGIGGIGPGGGAISQFENFGRGSEGSPFGGGQPTNPFAGLQTATAPMATAGMNSLNGAPTTTAPSGGLGGGGAPALSTGAPIGTMAHTGGGGPFTFGFPFGIDEGGAFGEDGGDDDREPETGLSEAASEEEEESESEEGGGGGGGGGGGEDSDSDSDGEA